MARPPGMPLAQISALKPAGSLSLSIGISLAGVSVILPACGASLDSACAGGLPWCQAGGCCWDIAGAANAPAAASAISLFIVVSPLGPLLELNAGLDANGHIALRRRLVEAPVGVIDDDRTGVALVGQVVDAQVLGDAPSLVLLCEAQGDGGDGISGCELGVGIVDRDVRLRQHLEPRGKTARVVPPAQFAVNVPFGHRGQAIAGGHDLRRGAGGVAVEECRVEQGPGERRLEPRAERTVGEQLCPAAARAAGVLESRAAVGCLVDHDLVARLDLE